MKVTSSEYRYQHLGSVYQLIEQFELISRTDLAKLSGFAPASMTMLTKLLIEHQFVIERTSQNLLARGRPSVGLSLSPFYWSMFCLTISPSKIRIAHCDLCGKAKYQKDYFLQVDDFSQFDQKIESALQDFIKTYPLDQKTLLAISVCVVGKLNENKSDIVTIGEQEVNTELQTLLQRYFSQPIFIHTHCRLWFLAESALGALIRDRDVIYLQLDTDIHLNLLTQSKPFIQSADKSMNVDKMLMPAFSLSQELAVDSLESYPLKNQITFGALIKLIDRYLPNKHHRLQEKIQHFCDAVVEKNPSALMILEHLTDNLAYMLMNLIHLFACDKVMFNSPLLQIKQPLFESLARKLTALLDEKSVDLVVGQYQWDSPMIPAIAVKNAIYEGELLHKHIQL